MKKSLSILIASTLLMLAVSVLAADKVVVIPLGRSASSAPQTQYFTVGSEAFLPGSNVDYFNTYGCGGAYIATGSGAMVAPVHLPHGAKVTDFKVFFDDTSAQDMSVTLDRQFLSSCGFSSMATVNSSGTSGNYSVQANTIADPIVNNTVYSYLIYAFSSGWSSSLKIKGALITYIK